MKKILCIMITILFVVSFIKIPVSADSGAPPKISRASVELPVDYFTTVSVTGAKGSIEWSTGNKNVASAEPRDGTSADIIGIGEGETYIYAKADGKTLKCRVTVKQSFISVSSKVSELCTGETQKISLAVSGSHNIAMKNSNKEVCSAAWGKWNNGIIDITLNAKSAGTSVIKVYNREHASTTAKTITVNVSDTEIISLDSEEEISVKPMDDIQHISKRVTETYEKLCDEMERIIAAYPYECEVLVESVEHGRLFSHNTWKDLPGGCTIKVAYLYYCCTQLEQGNHSLDEKITYQKKHYIGGSGTIRYTEYGSEWTIGQLIDLALRISDNVAYYMLVDVFGKAEFNKMVRDWGFSQQLYEGSNYPDVNAEFLSCSMLKFYEKKESSSHKAWKTAWNALLNGISTSGIRDVIDSDTAIKCGVPSSQYYRLYYNEVCLIEGESPYALVIISKADNQDGDAYFFKSIAECADKMARLSDINKA